jgi:hypothetical protein
MVVVLCFFFFCGSMGLAAPAWPGTTVDRTPYAELLEKYVKNGVVDYQGFKRDRSNLPLPPEDSAIHQN